MDEVLDYCQAEFDVKAITDDWLASIVDNNFTDFENTSSILKIDFFDFDVSLQTARFESLRDKLLRFEERVDDSEIWNELATKGVPPKKLTVIFWYAVELALVKNSGIGVVKAGLAAATAYLALCSIKGASAYNIFNQFFYERCFELFRHLQRCIAFGSRDSSSKIKPVKTKGKGKKKAAVEQHDETQDEEVKLDRGDVISMLEDLTDVFFVFFNKVSLGGYVQIIQPTTNLIRDICAIDVSKETTVTFVTTRRDFEGLSRMSDRAFALFHRLCHEKHSTGGDLVLSRIAYPRLAFWGLETNAVASGSTIPASFTLWKDLTVRFLKKRIQLAIPAEMNKLIQVLENAYCRCTDRQDYRTKVSHTIVEVLQLLPRDYQFEFIQRVDVFSKNAKNSVRNFTVDIVPLILKSLDLSGEDPGPVKDRNETMPDRTMANRTVKEEPDATCVDAPVDEPMQDEDEEDRAARKRNKKKKAHKKKNGPAPLPRVEALPALYECLIRYCVDKSSSVRGRAVVSLAAILRDPSHRDGLLKVGEKMLENDKWMFVGKEKKHAVQNVEGEEEVADQSEDLLDLTHDEEDIDNLFLHLIILALHDEKANVRKSALQAVVSFYPMIDSVADFEKTVTVIRKLCVDASVMVRKQAADSLNAILYEDSPFSDEIGVVWLEGVLPMINDREQSVVHTASRLISESIMNPLIKDTSDATWSLLAKIEQEDNHRRLLVRALFNQSQEGVINEKIVLVLLNKLNSFPQRCDVIWMILAELAVVFKVSPKSALNAWYTFEDGDRSNKVRYVTKVLTAACPQMTPSEKNELAEDLKKKIADYRVAAPHVSSVYLCLAKVLDGVGEEAPGRLTLSAFGVKVLTNCKKQVKSSLEQFASELDMTNGDSMESLENRLIRVITTIGEVIQFSPSLVDRCDELVNALKTIMASEQIQQDGVVRERILNSAVPSMGPSQFASQIPSRAPSRATAEVGLSEPSSEGSLQPSQKTAMSSQPIGPIIPHHHIGCQLFTSVVRAYCVLALGKFCLMDYKRAKEFVPVFVKQLRVNTDYVVRNNIIIVICDLCIRNTQLVDRYSPIIAGCLKDQSTLVRHQTLESLTNLIKEQFIRWEGQIMYRFVSTILDKDRKIREYAQFCLKNVLMQQFPDMFYRHFVECLLYFNEVSKKHITADSEDMDIDESLKFTLSGSRHAEARMQLYKFMLNTFDDKEKFSTMAHICEQALQPVLAGDFDFREKKVRDLLKDSFQLMSSKEIKLKFDVGRRDEEEDDEPPAAVVAAAKKMVTDVFRMGIIQAVMPVLLRMREFLVEQRSPLVKDCLVVLRAICIEHKDQIEEVLDGDKQLQAEIEYDIRRFEEQLAREEAEKKRKADEAAKERRRTRRSLLAGNVLMSGIKSATRTARAARIGQGAGRPLTPIKMEELHDEEEAQEKDQPAPVDEPMEQDEPALNAVAPEAMEVEQQLADIKVEEPETEENLTKTALPIASPTKSPLKEAGLSNIINTTSEVPARRRSGRVSKPTEDMKLMIEQSPKKHSFAIPAQRKRHRERSVAASDLNESTAGVSARAISTPVKAMPDVSFADLDLSAIRGDETNARPARTSSRRRSGAPRPIMDPISED